MDTLLAKLDRIGDSRHALSFCQPELGMDARKPALVRHPDSSQGDPCRAHAGFIDSLGAHDEDLESSPDWLTKS